MNRLPHRYLIGILLSYATLIGCSDDISTPVVHEDLQVYFDSFEFEGELRGLDIDLFDSEIHGLMETINERGVIGQCIQNNEGESIVVDLERWRRLDQLEKEFIVFHELGHCYLERGHIDNADENGTCMSIMHSSTTVCDIRYTSETRAQYLDELFIN